MLTVTSTVQSIQDFAPTLLHLMETSIADDVDGKVKREIFLQESSPYKRKTQFYTQKISIRKIRQLTPSEEEKIKERLRGLGYID